MKRNLHELGEWLEREKNEMQYQNTLKILANDLPKDFINLYTKIDIGNRIRDELNKCNGTQQELADYLNVSKSSVSKWLNGEGLTIDVILKLSLLFHCSTDYLIHGDTFKNPSPFMNDLYEVINAYNDKCNVTKMISLKDVFYFFIKDEIGDYYKRNGVNLEFFEKLANYFALEIAQKNDVILYDDLRKIEYTVEQKQLEELELLSLANILKEKKERFKKTVKYNAVSKDNFNRDKYIYECVFENEDNTKSIDDLDTKKWGKL